MDLIKYMTICHIINTTCFKRAPCCRQCVSAVSKSNRVYFTIQMVHEHSFPCRLLWELLHKIMVVAVRSLPFGQKLRYPELLACMFVLFFIFFFYYSLVGHSNVLWNLNVNISWKFDLECNGWGNICFGAAAWSWGWIKITSDYDSENDTDSGRDGLYSLFTPYIYNFGFLILYAIVMWFAVFILGRSCSKEVLACSVLEFLCSTW